MQNKRGEEDLNLQFDMKSLVRVNAKKSNTALENFDALEQLSHQLGTPTQALSQSETHQNLTQPKMAQFTSVTLEFYLLQLQNFSSSVAHLPGFHSYFCVRLPLIFPPMAWPQPIHQPDMR